MPIKPENRGRYPKNWKDIRAQILERAGHKCEKCGVHNHAIGYRNDDGYFVTISRSGKVSDYEGHATGYKVIMIVLTIAHLDHTPENCDMENLRAWCQRCHLAYDHDHHKKNARETRRKRLGNEAMALEKGSIAVYSILRDWIKAQVVAVETGLISFEEVFMAHVLLPSGQRMIEHARNEKLLPNKEEQ